MFCMIMSSSISESNCSNSCNPRSKRFRLVSEQRKTEERDSRFWPREKWNKSRSSFFAPKPHGNVCYAGYNTCRVELVFRYKYKLFSTLAILGRYTSFFAQKFNFNFLPIIFIIIFWPPINRKVVQFLGLVPTQVSPIFPALFAVFLEGFFLASECLF